MLSCPTCPRSEEAAEGDVTLAEEPNLFTCFEVEQSVGAHPPTSHSSLTLSVGLGDMRKSNMTMFWGDIRDMICIATRSNAGSPLSVCSTLIQEVRKNLNV